MKHNSEHQIIYSLAGFFFVSIAAIALFGVVF